MKGNKLHYLLNNNLNLNEVNNGVHLNSILKGDLAFLLYCVSYIRKHQFRMVIIHGVDYFIQAAVIKLLTGAKVILQHHAEKTYLRKKAKLMAFADRFIDGYFFNGKGVATPFIAGKCISGFHKILEVVEGSCDFQYSKKSQVNPKKHLIFIGRLNENKNAWTLLKSIRLVKEKRNDFKLFLYYSSNEQEADLKAYCREHQLESEVHFFGKIDRPTVQHVLNDADVFISCSLYEGSGYSLIEALACGCYPVVSSIGSFNFLLRGLPEKQQFNPLDEMELAAELHKALDIAFNNTLRKKIRTHFEDTCSPAAIASQIEKELTRLLL